MKLSSKTVMAMSLVLAACNAPWDEPTTSLTRTMKPVPHTENALALRTDFSDDAAWQSLRAAIERPVGDFRAYVTFVSDPQYAGLTAKQLASLGSRDASRSFAFIIDHTALFDPEHPILVVDLLDEPGRIFRVIPSEVWGVENNLSIANMDFADFTHAIGRDGIFRGFPNE